MKRIGRIIVLGLLVAGGAGYLLVAGVWSAAQPNGALCREVQIVVTDSAKRQFVGEGELHRCLTKAGIHAVGLPMDSIPCQEIEDCLRKHPMVRTAECYKTNGSAVCVRVTQRIPVLYVVSNDGCYYIDSDRKVMPVRASVRVQVPTFEGAISQRAAATAYFDFAQWLREDDYWASRIKSVRVNSPKDIVLLQRNMNARIVLGDLTDYEQKMNKLRLLYTKGFDQLGYTDYREYDLRFAGQVVGRK